MLSATLLDVFEEDHVGVLVLIRLLGFLPPEVHEDPGNAEPVELVMLAAETFAGLLERPPQRLLHALQDMRGAGWSISLERPDEGPSLRPPEGSSGPAAEAAAAELRSAILWAVCLRTAAALLHQEPPPGSYDLHSRAGGPAGAQLPTLDPEEVLAMLTTTASRLDQASAAVQLLPTLRSRLLLVLRSALELSAEEVVSVLCDGDPDGAELVSDVSPRDPGGPARQIHRARCQAMGKIRVEQDRARQSIEDALNSGRQDLSLLLRLARQGNLPEGVERLLSEWSASYQASPRDRRRVRSMARLAWLKVGAAAEAVARLYLFVPLAELKASEERMWLWAAEGPYGFSDELQALSASGSAPRTTAFLLRYVTWVHAGDRPGRETLGSILFGTPRGREAGERASRELFRAREAILWRLSQGRPAPRGPRPPAPPGPSNRVHPLVDRVRAGRAEHAAFRTSLRRELDRRLEVSPDDGLALLMADSGPAPEEGAWGARAWGWLEQRLPRWSVEGMPTFPLGLELAPMLGEAYQGPARRVILSLSPPADTWGWRPLVICRDDRGDRVVLPTHPGRWPRLDRFPFREGRARVAVHEEVGTLGWVILLVPPDVPIDWAAPAPQRWASVHEARAEGRLLAAKVATQTASVDSEEHVETPLQWRQHHAGPRGGK